LALKEEERARTLVSLVLLLRSFDVVLVLPSFSGSSLASISPAVTLLDK